MKYMNSLEAQLVAASRELSGAPDNAASRARTSVRTFARRHASLSTFVAVVVAVTAAGALADATGLHFPNLTAPTPRGPATTIPDSLSSSFAVLRRPRESQDALPRGTTLATVSGGVGAHYGINL